MRVHVCMCDCAEVIQQQTYQMQHLTMEIEKEKNVSNKTDKVKWHIIHANSCEGNAKFEQIHVNFCNGERGNLL